jgi:hypothetical protein
MVLLKTWLRPDAELEVPLPGATTLTAPRPRGRAGVACVHWDSSSMAAVWRSRLADGVLWVRLDGVPLAARSVLLAASWQCRVPY